MDVPFFSLKYVLNETNTDSDAPKYEPYGVVVLKGTGYNKGVRPVLYLSDDEVKELGIPDGELWRVVRFEVKDSDWISWLHEREWRCKGDFLVPSSFAAVLVRSLGEVEKLRNIVRAEPKAFKAVPKSIIPLELICQGLIYSSTETN